MSHVPLHAWEQQPIRQQAQADPDHRRLWWTCGAAVRYGCLGVCGV